MPEPTVPEGLFCPAPHEDSRTLRAVAVGDHTSQAPRIVVEQNQPDEVDATHHPARHRPLASLTTSAHPGDVREIAGCVAEERWRTP
ncbi:hypothetical protein [Nocardia sp. XZ_19_369]|uniref:hypothetical protein n=1 Tax=Nocardia sp. XZ_19_369 TaxID=2769487 RepID=UPI00188EF0BF|nr:hypothetical protein [Nocardia sp. XZ_19_369]